MLAVALSGLTLSAASLAAATPPPAMDLPAEFENDRVWLVPHAGGKPIRFFTDTGGGFNAVSATTAERLGLATREVPGDGGSVMKLADFPVFDDVESMPAAPRHFMGGQLAVASDEEMGGKQGFLGGRWFADGIWVFDYPRGRLQKLSALPAGLANEDRVALGFQLNASGQRTMHFPSMPVTVDGEVLDMLLDTGATATTTDASAGHFGVEPGTEVGTSFIERDVFDRWVQRNPDWLAVDGGDLIRGRAVRMIRVPAIQVGRHTVGPVWFAERPPGAFQKYMASMMDRPTWGALGGTGLKYFRIVVDYPGSSAYFMQAGEP